MCNYIVSETEIEKAESDIFENGSHFNDKQKIFLRCLDSCYLQAYAGTGKTSTIVGKLHILAQKRIWQNGRGVCIISHTNVAVDEIKKHVAKHYPEIMGYPNFVGTIQEFVNKFLFIPYLAFNNLQIKFQDDSRYFNYQSDLQDQTVVQRISNKLTQLNHSQNGDARNDFYERLNTIHLNTGKLYARGKNKGFTEFTDLSTQQVSQDIIVRSLSNLIQQQHNNGMFLFIESFVYGYEYLIKNPILKDILNHRFQYVFLDEAQDCSEIQLKLLNELFLGRANTVFQQIGDVNQDISDGQWTINNPLCLGESTRFGQNIAGFINKFQIDNGSGVTGRLEETKKVLITYDAGKEKDILPRFSKLLRDRSIPFDSGKGYFAISHKHDQLHKYFPNYSEKAAKNKTKKCSCRFENDIDYMYLINKNDLKKYGSQIVSNVFLNLLYKYYKERGGSWSELRESLRYGDVSDNFRLLVIQICTDILNNDNLPDLELLKDKLNTLLGEQRINFTSQNSSNSSLRTLAPENKYSDLNDIVVKVGTIHSVKGQTHNATLFFSNNEYAKQDIQHVLDNTPSRTPQYKKLIYVASSRAQFLFAFAMLKSNYDQLNNKSIFDEFELETI